MMDLVKTDFNSVLIWWYCFDTGSRLCASCLRTRKQIKAVNVVKGVTVTTSRRSNIIEETEKTHPNVDKLEAEAVDWGYYLRKTYL